MNDPLCIIATITPHPEHFKSARDALLSITPQTVEEAGCRTFRVLEGDDGQLRLYEEWDDDAALQAHYAQEYTKAVFAAYDAWLAKPVEILRLRRLA